MASPAHCCACAARNVLDQPGRSRARGRNPEKDNSTAVMTSTPRSDDHQIRVAAISGEVAGASTISLDEPVAISSPRPLRAAEAWTLRVL
jgi:hypothetical protein